MAMGTGASDFSSRRLRGRIRPDARLKETRKTRFRRALVETEFLEHRTPPATIPAAIPTTASPINRTGLTSVSSQGNANNPVVAIDPLDTSKMIAVWGVDLSPLVPSRTRMPSSRGVLDQRGTNLDSDVRVWPGIARPDSATAPTAYTQQTNPSVGFDRNGNFYVLESQHNAGNTSGAIILEKFNFSGAAPTTVTLSNSRPPYTPFGFGVPSNYNVLYQWVTTSDAAVYPTLLVDNNVASFTDPTTNNVQSDPYGKINTNPNPGLYSDVYVAWASIDQKPSADTDTAHFNPNRIKLVASSDGGNNFTGKAIANNDSQFGTLECDSQPQLVVDQNSGQVTIVWNDFGSASTASPPFSLLMSNSVTPGLDYAYQNGGQSIPNGGSVSVPFAVNIPANQLADLSNLTLSMGLTFPTMADLSIVLKSPNGDQITLLMNQNNAAGTANTGVGISGANLGVFGETTTFPGFAIGTNFDDSATRNIFDPTTTGTNANAAPAIGDFQPEGGFSDTLPFFNDTLKNFLAHEASLGDVNGTWNLVITDVHITNATTPTFLNYATMTLTTSLPYTSQPGLTPGTPVNMLAGAPDVTPTGDQLYGSLIPALGSITNTLRAPHRSHPTVLVPGSSSLRTTPWARSAPTRDGSMLPS